MTTLSKNQATPGKVVIERAVLTSSSGASIDIRPQLVELNIYESMRAGFTNGSVIIHDTQNLQRMLPITGHDKLDISFSIWGGQKTYSQLFYVYGCTTPTYTEERGKTYILQLCLPEFITNISQKLNKAYTGSFPTMAQQVFKDWKAMHPGNTFSRGMYVDDTAQKTEFTYIPPLLTPVQTIQAVAKRCFDGFEVANWMFYCAKDAYYFRSIESIAQDANYENYFYAPKNTAASNDDPMNSYRNVRAWRFKSSPNTRALIESGTLAATTLTHDIVTKQWIKTWFSSAISYNNTARVAKTGKGLAGYMTPIAGDAFNNPLWAGYNSKCHYVPEHSYLFDPKVKQYDSEAELLAKRQSHFNTMEMLNVEMTIEGDPDITIGKLINFNIPAAEQVKSSTRKTDEYYSGRFLVTEVRHRILGSDYKTAIELSKDGYGTTIPSVNTTG